jgi:hypothetical protein
MSRIAHYPNLVAGLEPFLNLPSRLPSPPPAPPRRGRRKALGTVRPVTELLWDIAEINSEGKACSSCTSIAERLRKRCGYRHLRTRTLRRDVAEVLLLLAGPIPGRSKKERRQQALEFLRNALRRITHRN